MADGLLQPIAERVLAPNQNLAVVVYSDQTLSKGEVRAWFFRVSRAFLLHLVYDQNLSSIAAAGTVQPNYIGDTGFGSGNDYLDIPDGYPFRAFHFSVGIRPPDIWLYRQYQGYLQASLEPDVGQSIGNKYGFVDGYLSPYEQPTAAAEELIVMTTKIKYGFMNNAAVAERPSLRFLGAAYDLIPITNAGFINKMISGIVPCRWVALGGMKNFTWKVPDPWPSSIEVNEGKLLEAMQK